MRFVCILFLLAAAVFLAVLPGCLSSTGPGAKGRDPGPYPERSFMSFLDGLGVAPSWECVRMADHVPPLPPEADKLFQLVRDLEKVATSPEEIQAVADGYQMAASLGHWKAMNNLLACYLYGTCTPRDWGKARELADQLIAMNVGSGWYARYIMERDEEFLHKAADLGEPNAQCKLGYHYLYPKDQDIRGLRYLVCATRQGHGEAAYEIGIYLKMFDSYYKAMEYFYRGAALGHPMAAFELADIFHPNYKPDAVIHTLGFLASSPPFNTYSEYFSKLWEKLKANPGTQTPDLFKKYPLPPNIVTTREKSLAKSSKLKTAFGGKWPDEIYPDLAPDYLPPKL